ncbi:MAG: hypothetical protein OXC65_12800 [Thiotrichales bacterium]|nr:hypothetical protein [Thiotrichales bacterium]
MIYKPNILCKTDPENTQETEVEMASSSGPASGTAGLLLEEFPVLSGAARKFVSRHPREARAAIAAALEAVAAQREVEDLADAPERLWPFVVRHGDDE